MIVSQWNYIDGFSCFPIILEGGGCEGSKVKV